MVKHTSFVCFYSVFFFASTFVLIQSKIGDSKNLIHKTNAISWMCEWGVCFKQNITDLCLVPNIVLSVMMIVFTVFVFKNGNCHVILQKINV